MDSATRRRREEGRRGGAARAWRRRKPFLARQRRRHAPTAPTPARCSPRCATRAAVLVVWLVHATFCATKTARRTSLAADEARDEGNAATATARFLGHSVNFPNLFWPPLLNRGLTGLFWQQLSRPRRLVLTGRLSCGRSAGWLSRHTSPCRISPAPLAHAAARPPRRHQRVTRPAWAQPRALRNRPRARRRAVFSNRLCLRLFPRRRAGSRRPRRRRSRRRGARAAARGGGASPRREPCAPPPRSRRAAGHARRARLYRAARGGALRQRRGCVCAAEG